MFRLFSTLKHEAVLINLHKILLVYQGKKGACLVLEDGSLYEVTSDFSFVVQLLENLKN